MAVHGLSFGNQLYPSIQKAWHRRRLDVWVAKQVDVNDGDKMCQMAA